jgi:pimeloyl-ACP methyl ester carboxylesterase
MRVRVRDLRPYFDVVGMGLVPDGPAMRERPVIVCLHGGPAFDHTLSKHLLAPLSDVAQLVFLDQRGCGRSDDCDPRLWTLDTWIEDVPAFCEALELSRPILLGSRSPGLSPWASRRAIPSCRRS